MHVDFIDMMGSDERVVDAARVSFHKIAANYTDQQNAGLISYLAKHNHFTPFTHVQITMREKVPIFVARQRFKHMVGFTYNEVSRRYVDDPPEFYTPDTWRKRAENKKQGSSDEVINLNEKYQWCDEPTGMYDDYTVGEMFYEHMERVELLYKRMLEVGVAPEQARMVLPQSMYTTYYCTGSLAAWARAYKLRIDPHAQKEIQDLAHMWGKVIGGIEELKYSWSALTE